MVMISDRPAEVDDRAVPGHWEGDLILGAGNKSAIGTLVERTTRYVILLHLPNGHSATEVNKALTKAIATLPDHLKGSLTWDQGSEMACHKAFSAATGVARKSWTRSGATWWLGSYFFAAVDCTGVVLEVDGADHPECRVPAPAVVDDFNPVGNSLTRGITGRPALTVIEFGL